ncbi:hypothetical protein [Streptomyces diastatochromogenes]|uniref:Uncharacterized protein n=1 Tax=Streptomyces diastatochromogenes TaxID=42236 RepID=A0A233S6J7_STRDA|nr:hypothetical protein [Streptomyces diastatochromogenes]MCZ0991499.1 hypothetical protein [Streptomyces diastatochromogenes]OXY91277.1 hypothetical protein BEK98_30485 [Streptomyces diastatochromogenes]
MEHAPFPPDLLQLQADWHRTYAALAAPHPLHPTALRRRLQILSGRLLWHPYWSGPAGTPAARVELRRRARTLEPLP